MMVKHAAMLVLLDGDWHTEAELICRLRGHFPPGMVVRNYARQRDRIRKYARRRNKSGRICLAARAADVQDSVAEVVYEEALAWLIRVCLSGQKQKRDFDRQKENGMWSWKLTDYGRTRMIGNTQICGKIAREFREALVSRGQSL
jgi:hypothetical protein